MKTFYDAWLGMWDAAEKERDDARRSIAAEELEWVETVQDARAALLVSPETGFRTWGTTSMIAEIPVGSHTGQHKHGEEAMFILEGSGYSVVDGVRYEWKKHSAILVPFGSVHQHFNTSDVPVRYLAVLAVHLEHYAGLHRTTQLEAWGRTDAEPKVPVSGDGKNPDTGERVVLHRENAIVRRAEGDGVPVLAASTPEFDPEHPLVLSDVNGMLALPDGVHKSQTLQYMRINRDWNDFHPREVEISGLLSDGPREVGGMHAHMEAHLYVIAGEGYTEMEAGKRVYWRPGSAFHVPGPQTPHRYVNQTDEPTTFVRMAFGFRYFLEQVAKREFPYLYLAPRQAVLDRSTSKNLSGR